jgi:hypothetical protein
LLSTRETVRIETPARCATSLMVAIGQEPLRNAVCHRWQLHDNNFCHRWQELRFTYCF